MAAFPTSQAATTYLDQSTDSPANARTQLLAALTLLNQIIDSFGDPSGICPLDSSGLVPAANLPAGASSGVDADLLDGQHGAYYLNAGNLNAGTLPAARFSDAAHGNRSGGSLHAYATTSANGFVQLATFAELLAMTASTQVPDMNAIASWRPNYNSGAAGTVLFEVLSKTLALAASALAGGFFANFALTAPGSLYIEFSITDGGSGVAAFGVYKNGVQVYYHSHDGGTQTGYVTLTGLNRGDRIQLDARGTNNAASVLNYCRIRSTTVPLLIPIPAESQYLTQMG